MSKRPAWEDWPIPKNWTWWAGPSKAGPYKPSPAKAQTDIRSEAGKYEYCPKCHLPLFHCGCPKAQSEVERAVVEMEGYLTELTASAKVGRGHLRGWLNTLRAVLAAFPREEQIRADERAKTIEECARIAEDGNFLHDASPAAQLGRQCADAIRRLGPREQDKPDDPRTPLQRITSRLP